MDPWWRVFVPPCALFVATVSCGDSKSLAPSAGSGGNAAGDSAGVAGLSAASGGLGGRATGGSAGRTSGGAGVGGAAVAGGSAGAPTGAGGVPGASGLPGVAGATGGDAPVGGEAGAAGSGGAGGTSPGTPEICTFELDATLSPAIPTVGIVNWSTDLADLDEASVEFTLHDPAPEELNRGSGGKLDITGTTHRALLLGLKAERTYRYRLLATAGDTTCISPDQWLTTGPATGALEVAQNSLNPAARAPGFIVTTGYLVDQAVIIDADGDVVWWTETPGQPSRALMDWEGENMWFLDANPTPPNAGHTRRIGMDGSGATEDLAELAGAHHDLTALPGGAVATLRWAGEGPAVSDLVVRSPDGTVETVVRLDEAVWTIGSLSNFHTNSVLYHPTDDTFTVGDLYSAALIKLTREGELLWQLDADCTDSRAPKCATAEIGGNHGHQVLENGNLLVFKASYQNSPAEEYALTEGTDSLTATLVWSYETDAGSEVLGDVQRLPNGNTLLVYSNAGLIHEISPTNELVRTLEARTFGYASFRETLYGPPIK
jgi:hypothetical protein